MTFYSEIKKQLENVIRIGRPYTMATKLIWDLGTNLTKNMQDLFSEIIKLYWKIWTKI